MDLVLTWPQKHSLESYIENLKAGAAKGETILYRVSQEPKRIAPPDRVYMVHSGFVRGWTQFIDCTEIPPVDPRTGKIMQPGFYIVRSATWHRLWREPTMKGFRGFRYAHREWRLIPEIETTGAIRVDSDI